MNPCENCANREPNQVCCCSLPQMMKDINLSTTDDKIWLTGRVYTATLPPKNK